MNYSYESLKNWLNKNNKKIFKIRRYLKNIVKVAIKLKINLRNKLWTKSVLFSINPEKFCKFFVVKYLIWCAGYFQNEVSIFFWSVLYFNPIPFDFFLNLEKFYTLSMILKMVKNDPKKFSERISLLLLQ